MAVLMITFNSWINLLEGKKPKKSKPVVEPKKDDNTIEIKIDQTKIATGHQPHMSGAGIHGSKPKPRKKDWKNEMD